MYHITCEMLILAIAHLSSSLLSLAMTKSGYVHVHGLHILLLVRSAGGTSVQIVQLQIVINAVTVAHIRSQCQRL